MQAYVLTSIDRKSFFTDHKLNRPFNYAYQLERKLHFVVDPVGVSIDVLVVITSNTSCQGLVRSSVKSKCALTMIGVVVL